MGEIQRALVTAFLNEFKRIAELRGIDLVDRKKNFDSIAALGLTVANAKAEIMSLSAADYCAGPKVDKDRPGHIWEFGEKIGSTDVYIKLKIAQLPDGEKIAKCISFHAAEFSLCFPLL